MSKMIQVRHVPDKVHRRLTNLARQSRMSLSDYLLAELQRSSDRPAPAEILARLSRLRPVASRVDIVRALREERDRA
jgi:antitoxin FitA